MNFLKITFHLLWTLTDQVQRQIMIKTAIVLNFADWVSDKLQWKATVEKPSEAQGHSTDSLSFEVQGNRSKKLILCANTFRCSRKTSNHASHSRLWKSQGSLLSPSGLHTCSSHTWHHQILCLSLYCGWPPSSLLRSVWGEGTTLCIRLPMRKRWTR